MNKGIKPIKRSESIIKLSREHHFSLLFGWKIRQGLKNNTQPLRIIPYVHYFWKLHILPHFREEEEILFPAGGDALVARAKQEHAAIQSLVEKLAVNPSLDRPEDLRLLADSLDKHIRFEERELFPHLEKTLSPDQLEHIGRQLKEAAGPAEKDDYADEFWNLKSSL